MNFPEYYLKKEIKKLLFDSQGGERPEGKKEKTNYKLIFFLGFSAPIKFY